MLLALIYARAGGVGGGGDPALLHCSRDHAHPPQVKSLLRHPSPAADDGFVGE